MPALTFLDYSHLESSGKSIESKLEEKEKEISYLRTREINTSDEIASVKLKHEQEMKNMNERLDKIVSLIQENPKLAKVKRQVLCHLPKCD